MNIKNITGNIEQSDSYISLLFYAELEVVE